MEDLDKISELELKIKKLDKRILKLEQAMMNPNPFGALFSMAGKLMDNKNVLAKMQKLAEREIDKKLEEEP